MADFLPDSQVALVTWATNFLNYLTANQATLGLVPADVTTLQTRLSSATTAFNNDQAIHAQMVASTQTLKTAMDSLEQEIRLLNGKLQANPAVTNAQKAAMGLTIASARGVIPAPSSHPGVASIEASGPLTLTLHFGNVEGTVIVRKRPDHASACQIYAKVGTAPAAPDECEFLGIDTRTPFEAVFAPDEAGKRAYFYLRWMNAKGETGPWGPLAQATIPG